MSSFAFRLSMLTLLVCFCAGVKAQYVREGDTLFMKGYRIIMDKTGFPLQVAASSTTLSKGPDSLYTPMLTEPVHFHISDSATHKDMKFTSSGITYTAGKQKTILLEWQATNTSPKLEMEVKGSIQQGDVTFLYVTLRALQTVSLLDVKLHLPYIIEKNQYVAGLGRKGPLTDTIQWKWPARRKDDGVAVNAGKGSIWLVLNDDKSDKRSIPATWHNNGKGGLWIGIKGKSLLEEAYSGPRTLQAGDTLHYNFALITRAAMH